jgi:tetratricopeptide (TPR) repeat protein
MTSSPQAHPRNGFRRRIIAWTAAFLILGTAGGVYWWTHRPPPAPTPPSVPENKADPEVVAVVEKVREEVLREPRSSRAWGRLGQAFLANDMEKESSICFAEAERLDPANPRWLYYQGGILINQGKPDAALPFFQKAVERGEATASDNLVPRLMAAEALLTLGRLDEAEEQFRNVLMRQDSEIRAHYGLALVYAARADWKRSRTHLLRCAGDPFAQQKACVQLAAVCLRLGDEAEAEKFRRLANLLPMDRDWLDPFATEYLPWAVKKRMRYRHAESLEAAGNLAQAMEVLRPMIAEYPNDYLPRVTLAKLVGRMGDHVQAEQLLREALQIAPDKVQVHYYLSLVLFTHAEAEAQHGSRERANALYREAIQRAKETLKIKPDYGFAFMTLGLSLKGLGQRAEALAALRDAVRCNPEHAELHFYLGEMLVEEGRRDEARDHLKQAVEMGPANAAWRPRALAGLKKVASSQ